MSKRQVTTCDVCGEEIKWFHGARVGFTESNGTKYRAYPHGGVKELDLCDEHYKPFVEVLAKLGVDYIGIQAEQARKYPSHANQQQADRG